MVIVAPRWRTAAGLHDQMTRFPLSDRRGVHTVQTRNMSEGSTRHGANAGRAHGGAGSRAPDAHPARIDSASKGSPRPLSGEWPSDDSAGETLLSDFFGEGLGSLFQVSGCAERHAAQRQLRTIR